MLWGYWNRFKRRNKPAYLDRDIEECTELIEVLEKYNLITLSDDKEMIYIKSFNTYTGVDDAKTRMRNSRERNKQQKSTLS